MQTAVNDMYEEATLVIGGDPNEFAAKIADIRDRGATLVMVSKGTCDKTPSVLTQRPFRDYAFQIHERRLFSRIDFSGKSEWTANVTSVEFVGVATFAAGNTLHFRIPVDPDSDRGILIRACEVLDRRGEAMLRMHVFSVTKDMK